MDNIKENFKDWLIKNKKYKTSTSKNFIGIINRICKKFCGHSEIGDLIHLSQNMPQVLIYYNECNNRRYFISLENADKIKKHLYTDVLRYLNQNNMYPDVRISFVYNAKKYFLTDISLDLLPTYINAFEFLINEISQPTFKISDLPHLYTLSKLKGVVSGDLSNFFDKAIAIISENSEANTTCAYLQIDYKENVSNQVMKGLWLFYEFLNTIPSATGTKEQPCLGYDELKNLILCINTYFDGLMKIITLTPWTGDKAKQIKANNGNSTLYPYEVKEALDWSPALFRKMVKQGMLRPQKEKGRLFSDSDVNILLQNALHKVTYPDVDYTLSIHKNDKIRKHPEIWCTREQAAKILKRNVSTVDSYKKNGVLTYIETAPNSAFFYIPELEKVAKLIKTNHRRCLSFLKKYIKNNKIYI